MENARTTIWVMAAVLAFVVTPALAAPTEDNFWIDLTMTNEFLDGGGSGFDDGTGVGGTPWYYYENTRWYSQWFYDDLPDPTRYKKITYDIFVDPKMFWQEITIALNWSTLTYPESGPDGPPPLPPFHPSLEDLFIVREVIFENLFDIPYENHIVGTFIIPDYNPEWVSIDIRVKGDPVSVTGTITHECIPAPGAIVLGSIGVGLVGWLRRRRKL